MKLRRGLFRVWLVASCVWFAGWLVYVWHTCQPQGSQLSVYCRMSLFDDWVKQPQYFTLSDYASIIVSGLAVPIGAFILGLAALWAADGFMERPKSK
jgi:hypothetical protein